MNPIPTARLHLRRFNASDAEQCERLVGETDVAAMTHSIPHPYPKGGALQWMEATRPVIERGALAQFAVVETASDVLVGCLSFRRPDADCNEAEVAYWLGKPFWGRGYMTEAARGALEQVRLSWRLASLWACVLPQNHRSQRVLAKLGMVADGEMIRPGAQALRLLRFRICLDRSRSA